MSAPGRRQLLVLGACALAMALHQAVRWDWTIDDAAICYAYARNLATGAGAVPWPGGERIEAYSDPTWVALLALLYRLGLDGFTVAKPLGVLFGVGTLALVHRLAERAMPEREHRGPRALIAPIALAVNAQFAIWSASGLENALFCLLLSGAILQTARDIDALELPRPRLPWAAPLWVLLAWTRPEGVLYAGIGGAVFARRALGAGRGRAVAWWALLIGVPLALSELARIAYFAWPLPNTFYAKIASRGVAPLDWSSRGWSQLRDWSDRLWHGYLVPVYLLGLTGLATERDRRRARIGLAAALAVALSLLWPGTADLRALSLWPPIPEPPAAYELLRIAAIALAGLLLPLLAADRPGGDVRLMCGWSIAAGLGFSVLVNGDWMGAYRFMSLVTPCLAVLFAAGLAALLDEIELRLTGSAEWTAAGWLGFAFGTGILIPPNLSQTRDHSVYNINETTRSVKQRVDHTRGVLRRTFWDGPVTNLDVDQGAHLWWAPDYVEVDMAMLVDIPMARHWYQQRDFIREYVFGERRPTFAHVGGWWARHTGFRKYPEWAETYFELPSYADYRFPEPFRGVFARRELVVAPPTDPRPEPLARFDWDIALEGVAQPAPWTPGQPGYVEVRLSLDAQRGQDATVTGFLARDGRVVHSFRLPTGYGLLPMADWRPGEVFRGRHAVPVPADLAPGRYDLGLWLIGPRGYTIPLLSPSAGTPVLARGEIVLPAAIEVVDAAEHAARIDAARREVHQLAASGACGAAEDGRVRLERHRPTAWTWHDAERPPIARALAECWAGRASSFGSPAAPGTVDALARAHRWDPSSPGLAERGAPVAAALLSEGRAARAAADWQTAYARFAAVLRFQPWRAWARRWAEEARDHRLGLTDDVRIGIGGDNDLRAWEEAGAKGGAE